MHDDELEHLRQVEDEAAEQVNVLASETARAAAIYERARRKRLRYEAAMTAQEGKKRRHLRSLAVPGLVGAGGAVARDVIENVGSAAVAAGAVITAGVVTAAALTHIPDHHPGRRAVPPLSAPSPARPPQRVPPSTAKRSLPPAAERVRVPAPRRHTATATPGDGTVRPLRPVKAVRTVPVRPAKALPKPSSVPAPRVTRLIDLRHPLDIRTDLRLLP